MLFNSYEFILFFLPLTLIIYFLLTRAKQTIAAKSWLVLSSLFFYGWWNPKYLPLLIGSILFNYCSGAAIYKATGASRKRTLIFAIAANIALLGYFKYTNFFIENISRLTGAEVGIASIVLPLAISFFTFTQIAFLVDTYNKEAKDYSLVNYSLFVTFFPHLLAGPIIHHKEMMPQFDSTGNKLLNYDNLTAG
ncbi:MAG: MBOAT family O-acyltransferase, partial [Thermodesulfobacteriota bacterium]